jgi:drug/metabolite transporter (DMT)-like permease
MVGAGPSTVLTATAPVLAIPFSVLWLRERRTRGTLLGALLTPVGVALVA